MLAGALADSDVFQVVYPLLLIPVSTVLSALYADWRAKKAPRPPAGGTALSVTQVLHVHRHPHYARGGSAPARKPKRTGRSFADEDPLAALVLFVVGLATALYLIARGFAAARDELLFAVMTLAGVNLGTALGAFTALGRFGWFDRSWRWPAVACASVAAIGVLDVYLLVHPAFATGDYEQVFQTFLRGRPIFEGAFGDVDANAFLAFQGLAALVALLVLVLSLILVLGVWAAIEESVGLRPGLLRRGARRLVPRNADRRGASILLIVVAAFSATLCAGWYYNLFKRIQARWDHDGPRVSSLSARVGSKRVDVRMTVSEPVRVVVTVERGKARSGGRATFELRPGRRRVSLYARADRVRLPSGRYTVSIVLRDEAGNVTRRERFVRVG